MNVKSYALCLLAVGFLFVSQAASPSEWIRLQPLSPSLPMASGLDGNGTVDTIALNAWHELESQGWDVSAPRIVGEFAAVKFNKGDQQVIAFRGTDNLIGDSGADTAIALPAPAWDGQFDEAIKFAEQILFDHLNDHISVTGHSLGGALAQVVAKMFDFDGVTFDPGGAQNIADAPRYNAWADKLRTDHPLDQYPDISFNQGSKAAFTNYVIADSLVSGKSGDSIGRKEQLDFFAYATTEELVIQSSTKVAHFALDKYKLGFLADAVTGALTTLSFHKMDGILDLMSIKKYDQITIELQQKYQETLQQASNTGDVGIAGSSYGQPQTVFYSTTYNPYVFVATYLRRDTIKAYPFALSPSTSSGEPCRSLS